jgi:hypothetical protein
LDIEILKVGEFPDTKTPKEDSSSGYRGRIQAEFHGIQEPRILQYLM